jgi:PKD repeat protein
MKQRRFPLRLAVLVGCMLAFVVSSVSPAIAAPPENDNIGSAVVIDSLPYQAVQDTSEATWADGFDPSCLGGVTVWYTFTPTSEIGLDINTFGSDYNTTLGVFWGNPSNPQMSSFGCTDGLGGQTQITFGAPAGLKLYIGVGAHQPLGGNLVLSVTQIPPPANDDFANAKAIAALPFSETLDLSGATRDPGQPSTGCSRSLSHSVWYAYTPANNAPVTATLVDGVVGVFRGTSIADLAQVACSEPGLPLTLQLVGDTAYYFAVSDDNATGGVVTFNLADAPSPVAAFHYSPWNPTPLSPTSFADDSFDPGGRSFASRLWDFGDGASASGCCPDHQFAADGDYTVTLTVTTTDGRTDSASIVVPVRTPIPSPVADFHYDPLDPNRVSTISFTDDSIDPAGQTFVSTLWYFGDGTSASGCCPNHQYAEDGDYAVTLTVTTTDGRTDNRTRIVSVRTHDVAIVSVDVPKVGIVGSTKTVSVSVASGDYTENVQVSLLRSVPGGFETVDLQTQTIPASTTAAFRFTYTFTSSDASLGTIAFQAHTVITDQVDPIPVDNVLTSKDVKVVGKR